MKPIDQAWVCHIEVTNVCGRGCVYCSRFDRHIRADQRTHMTLDQIEKALQSLDGWPNQIGIMGGEPTLHPQFEEICHMLRRYNDKSKYGLWTAGGSRYDKYKHLIDDTFGFLAYNEHTEAQQTVCRHQAITMGIDHVVPDEEYRGRLIDDCWVQKTWCPSIGAKGAFFCEVAYALDTILDGPGGYPVEPGWWKKAPAAFADQVARYCGNCGMAIPLPQEVINTTKEKISRGNLELFRAHNLPRLSKNDVVVVDGEFTVKELECNRGGWDPGNYRQDITG